MNLRKVLHSLLYAKVSLAFKSCLFKRPRAWKSVKEKASICRGSNDPRISQRVFKPMTFYLS